MRNKEKTFKCCWWTLIAAAGIAAALLLCGCTTTRYVPVVEKHVDTTYITKWQHDSIHVHDSTLVWQKGDTVLVEKWHTKYVEKQVHDTTYISKKDTVPQPYPVPEYVEKELSWWQRFRMNAGGIALGLLAVCVGYGIFRFIKRM